MSLTVTAIARTRRLTSVASAKQGMGLGTGAHPDDTFFDALVEQATAAILAHTGREWARATLKETLPGFGDTELMLNRTPVVAVTQVLCDSDPITDYVLDDSEAGILFRKAGWGWSVQVAAGLGGRQRWPGFGAPIPGSEERRFTVDYVGGYLLADQDLLDVTTISVDAADDSLNDSASAFPPDLRAGETVLLSGFQNAANNGRFLVAEAPTAGKIKLTASLVTEAAGASVSVRFDPPPGSQPRQRLLERAANVAVKTWHMSQKHNPELLDEGHGTQRRQYSDAARATALPPAVIAMLSPLVRAA